MTRRFAQLSVALLTACSNEPDRLEKLLLSAKTEEVVVSTAATKIGEQPTILTAPGTMRVVGGMIAVCYVLRDGVAREELPRIFEKSLGSIMMKTVVQLGNGERHEFAPPMPAWNAEGKTGGKNELAACSSYRTCTPIPIGSEIAMIEASASSTIDIKGIYFMSGTLLDPRDLLPEKAHQKPPTAAQTDGRTRCKGSA